MKNEKAKSILISIKWKPRKRKDALLVPFTSGSMASDGKGSRASTGCGITTMNSLH
jgi:hypothetical protein